MVSFCLSEGYFSMDDEDRTIFRIPAENLEKFEAACAKLSKKALKMGCSEIKPFIFGHTMETLADGLEHRVYEVLFTVETPKIDGWVFVARLDHSNETGNIIRLVPNTVESLPDHFRDVPPNCDHCNLLRKRRDTFVLRCETDGAFKQVGSSCLKDFFGHDPIKMARMAELLGYAYEAGRAAEYLTHGLDLRWVRVERFCQYAAMAVRLYGWVSGKAAYENPNLIATRERAKVWNIDGYSEAAPTDEDKKLAADALEWAQSLRDKDNKSEYEHNILVIAEAEVIEARSMGLAASIVGVYVKNLTKPVKTDLTKSKHVGNVGDKLTNVSVTVLNTFVFNSAYNGTTYVYKMLTTEGNVLTWFASTTPGSVIEGQQVKITGRIKAHNEYKGVKETVLTRCKVLV